MGANKRLHDLKFDRDTLRVWNRATFLNNGISADCDSSQVGRYFMSVI